MIKKQGGPHGGMRWGQEQEEMVEKWGLLSNERGSVGRREEQSRGGTNTIQPGATP